MSQTTTNRLRLLRRGEAAEAHPAIPAMPVPRGEPDETWTDDALNEYGQSELAESSSLSRKSVRARFRAGHPYSILRKRYKGDDAWVRFQKDHDLPRTKVWETIEVYERATAAGHTEDDMAEHETWTAAMLAYGVVKEREKAQEPVEAVQEKSDGERRGPAMAEAPTTAAAVAAATPGDKPAEAEAAEPVAAVPDIGDDKGQALSAGTDQGDATGKAESAPAPKARKRPAAEATVISPTEIGYAENFIRKMGGWAKTAEIVEAVTAFIAVVEPHTWERVALAIQEARTLREGAK